MSCAGLRVAPYINSASSGHLTLNIWRSAVFDILTSTAGILVSAGKDSLMLMFININYYGQLYLGPFSINDWLSFFS